MQDQLTGGRGCDLPCLHDDDALVPRFDRFEELHLHRQGLERDQLLAVLVLHLEQLRERAQVTQQLLDLGPELCGNRRRDVGHSPTNLNTFDS